MSLVVSDGNLDSEPAFARITASPPGAAVDLSLAIGDSPDPVVRKQPVIYTLTVTNQSADMASDVRLDLALSGDVRGTPVVDGTSSCSPFVDGTLSCQVADQLGAGAVTQVTLRITPKRPGLFSVEATVSSASWGFDPLDNTVIEDTTVLK